MLKEIAVSTISMVEDGNNTIHVNVDYRVGICPLNANTSGMTSNNLGQVKSKCFSSGFL